MIFDSLSFFEILIQNEINYLRSTGFQKKKITFCFHCDQARQSQVDNPQLQNNECAK